MHVVIMKRFLFFIFILPQLLNAQKVINVEYPANGSIEYSEKTTLQKINSGYTLWLPQNEVKGMVVFFEANRDTANQEPVVDIAFKNHLAVLYVTTDNMLEFLFEDLKMLELENYMHEVIIKFAIPKDNLLYCGMSLAGTRALKMAAFSQSIKSKYKVLPKAIAICDAPLDMVRFFRECKKASDLNLNEIAATEGEWVSSYLKKNMHGTPGENMKKYIEYSSFCYTAENGGQAFALKNINLRAYTEPDVIWWIENRGKDYYSMNAIDLAALINQLKISGSKKATLITTDNKGYRPDGSRHPHSWSIVDEKELLDWFVNLKDEKSN